MDPRIEWLHSQEVQKTRALPYTPAVPEGTEELSWGPNPGRYPMQETVWFGASSAAHPL